MAENYEFISAANLPTTDAKEVDVICVEGGELKRKPGASIGGGGYVIKLPIEIIAEVFQNNSAILEESRDNFAEILYNGGSVWIDASDYLIATGESGVMRVNATAWTFAQNALIVTFTNLLNSTTCELIFPNGTWTPPTAE